MTNPKLAFLATDQDGRKLAVSTVKRDAPRPLTADEREQFPVASTDQLDALAAKFAKPITPEFVEIEVLIDNNGFTNPRTGSTDWKRNEAIPFDSQCRFDGKRKNKSGKKDK